MEPRGPQLGLGLSGGRSFVQTRIWTWGLGIPGMIADRIAPLAHRPALALLALAALASLLGSVWGSPWLAAMGGAVFPVALMALGAARKGRLGPLRGPLLLLGIVLAGVFAALVVLPDGGPEAGPLPLGTVLMLFVLVPVPFLLVSWAYAAFFDRWFLREEDLERIRRADPR